MRQAFPWRRFAVSLSGTLIAQGIAMLAQPLLRRLYAPEAFGELSLYLSIAGVLGTVAPLRFELALMLPRTSSRILELFLGAAGVNTIFSLIVTLSFWIGAPWIKELLRLPEGALEWLPWVGPAVWAYGVFLLFQQYFSRSHHYGKVNALRIMRRLPECVAQAGACSLGPVGLIVGEMIGRLTMIITGCVYFFNDLKNFPFHRILRKRLWLQLAAHRQFPLHSFLPTFFNALALLAPSLIVNYHFGSYENGLFDMCLQIVALPVGFMITSLSNVILAEVSECYRHKKSVLPFLRKTSAILMGAALLMSLAVWGLGPRGFGLLFGATYEASASYAVVLLPALGSRLVVAPLAVTFAGLNQIRQSVWWQYAYAIGIFSLFFLPFGSMFSLILTYSFIEFSLNSLYLWQIFWLSRKYEKSLK